MLLISTLQQIKQLGFHVLISTHYPLPAHIVELADYVLYEKKNVLSDDWRATYSRRDENGHLQEKECRIPYHGVACLNAIRNAIDFCHPKFDRMFYIEYDSEVDVDIFVDKVRESSAPFVGVKYEGQVSQRVSGDRGAHQDTVDCDCRCAVHREVGAGNCEKATGLAGGIVDG